MLTAEQAKELTAQAQEKQQKLLEEKMNQYLEERVYPRIRQVANLGQNSTAVNTPDTPTRDYVIKALSKLGYEVDKDPSPRNLYWVNIHW
jgi:hypothetical protein